jgi:hypothetical protein
MVVALACLATLAAVAGCDGAPKLAPAPGHWEVSPVQTADRIVAVDSHTTYAFTVDDDRQYDLDLDNDRYYRILRWNGSTWSALPAEQWPQAIAARGRSGRWAVRKSITDDKDYLQHWTDSWQKVVAVPSDAVLETSVASDHDVWIAGGDHVARWDGTRLRSFPLPVRTSGTDHLQGVYAVSAADVWMVGGNCAKAPGDGWMLHWDGKALRKVDLPDGTPCLLGLVRSGSTLYAYGQGLLRLDGGDWQAVQVPDRSPDWGFAACDDGHGGIWLGGTRYLHYTPKTRTWSRYGFGAQVTTGQASSVLATFIVRIPGTDGLFAKLESSGGDEGTPDAQYVEQYEPS